MSQYAFPFPAAPRARAAGRAAVAAVVASAAMAGSTMAASPAQAAPPDPSPACSFRYANPNFFPVQASASVFVRPAGRGAVAVRLVSNPLSIAGYQQQVSMTWANLDTGKSGDVTGRPTRVSGVSATIRLPRAVTGVGRVTMIVRASNTSSITPTANTNGDCGTEYLVR